MKSIISFLAVISFAAVAIAQEESPSPSESTEEKPSATVEESPEATVAATVAASPKASAAVKGSTAGAKKEASPAAAAAKKTTATAAAPAKKMSVEAALKDNENRWEAAVASHDSKVAESLVASDFTGFYWDGKMMTKSSMIAMGKKDKDTYKSAVNEKLAVHSFSPTVAVVVGTAREKGTGKDGKAFDHTYHFTDTWMERNGQWQCVASQIMKAK